MKIVGGKDRTAQSIRGLANMYEDLFRFKSSSALQLYFGVDEFIGGRIHARKLAVPTLEDLYRDVISIGARGSGKTYPGCMVTLRSLTDYPQNEGLIVRQQWSGLRTSIMADLELVINAATDGKPEYLVDGPERKEGFYRYTVFTEGKPSRLIVKPEPDRADDREIEDALKGPQYGIVMLDELTGLKEITWSTLQDNLRCPFVPFPRIIGLTNPPVKGHWLYKLAKQMDQEKLNGRRPGILIIRSKMSDNPFLREDYIERMKDKYRNDPIKYAMYVEGLDGINVTGVPVYKGAFSLERNTGVIDVIPGCPLMVGMDFGWTMNAAVFGQLGPTGYINVLGELQMEHTTIERFGQGIKEYITRRWPHVDLGDVQYYGDPNTAVQRNMHSGITTAQLLRKKCNIPLRYKKISVQHGIDNIKGLLVDHGVEGSRPRLMFDKRYCTELINGFLAGYCWKEWGGTIQAEPDKDGYYDHSMDAIRYWLDNTTLGRSGAGVSAKPKVYEAEGMMPMRRR